MLLRVSPRLRKPCGACTSGIQNSQLVSDMRLQTASWGHGARAGSAVYSVLWLQDRPAPPLKSQFPKPSELTMKRGCVLGPPQPSTQTGLNDRGWFSLFQRRETESRCRQAESSAGLCLWPVEGPLPASARSLPWDACAHPIRTPSPGLGLHRP